MSRLTSAALVVVPGVTNAPVATVGGTIWGYGAWVELSPAVPATAQLAGAFCFVNLIGPWDVEFGIGSAGAEVGVGHLMLFQANSSGTGHNVLLLPVPLDVVPAGSRLAVRVRRNGTSGTATVAALVYYGLGADHVAASAHPHVYLPFGANGVSITLAGTAWTNSAWVPVTTGLSAEVALTGIALQPPTVNGVQWEVDLGVGSAGAEAVVTTFRGDSGRQLGFMNQWLPAPFPVAGGTRIAVRLRKSDTSVGTLQCWLTYLEATALLAVPRVETFIWMPV